MRRRGPLVGRLLLVAGLATVVASCGDDEAGGGSQAEPTQSADPTPAVCETVDSLSASVASLQDLKVDRDVLRVLSAKLQRIDADVRQLADDASAEYGDEVDTVKSSAAELELSVRTASEATSSASISAVAADVRSLGISVEALATTFRTTC